LEPLGKGRVYVKLHWTFFHPHKCGNLDVLRVMSRLRSWNLLMIIISYAIFITQFTTNKRLVKQGFVSHFCLAIYIEKYVKAKERRIMETQIYFTMQKYNLQKMLFKKKNQNPSRYYNSIITNLKFQHKPKYHLSKILISK